MQIDSCEAPQSTAQATETREAVKAIAETEAKSPDSSEREFLSGNGQNALPLKSDDHTPSPRPDFETSSTLS
jgi:hypothetical protein